MKKDNLSPANLVDRLTSTTPSFWKKMQKIALIVGVVAGTVLTGGIAVPAIVTTIATYAAAVSGTVLGISQLTKEDTADASTEPTK